MSRDYPHEYRPVIRECFYWEEVPEGCLLYEEGDGRLVVLNPSAELVLTYCDGEHSLCEIKSELGGDERLTSDMIAEALERLIEARVVLGPVG
jgi:hypothetical protein